MGENYSENLHSIKKTGKDLTLKQMFEISEKLMLEQSDENSGVNTISWEDFSWKQVSLVNDEEVISLSHAMVHVFSDSVLCLGKMNQNPSSNTVWEDKLSWFKDSPQYRTLDTIDEEPMEFEWNIFPGFTTLQLCNKNHEFMSKMGDPSQLPTLSIEIPAQENLLQKHKERVERLSQHDRLIKICTDARFLTTVEVGQYFMTKTH